MELPLALVGRPGSQRSDIDELELGDFRCLVVEGGPIGPRLFCAYLAILPTYVHSLIGWLATCVALGHLIPFSLKGSILAPLRHGNSTQNGQII